MLPAHLQVKILMSEGIIWSVVGTNSQGTLQSHNLLLTRLSTEGGVAPELQGPSCALVKSEIIFYTFKRPKLWQNFHFLLGNSLWGKNAQRQQTQKGVGMEGSFNLHTASAPCGVWLLPAARLAFTEQRWYSQTCKKTSFTWHVIWRSRCRLTKAAHPCMETKTPKWHWAITYVGHVNISHGFA